MTVERQSTKRMIFQPHSILNPSNAEASFVQCTGMQRFFETIQSLSYWYPLDIALIDCSQMNTHLPGFHSFFSFFA